MEKNKPDKTTDSFTYDLTDTGKGELLLNLTGSINSGNVSSFLKEIKKTLKRGLITSLKVDLEKISYMDDYGVLALSELRDMLRDKGAFQIINAGEEITNIISLMDFDSIGKKTGKEGKESSNIFVHLGEDTLNVFSDLKYMVSFMGAAVLAFIYVITHPRALRKDDTIYFMQRAGVDALPIVGLISFLLGLIIAFMSSIQLRQFGADIYVASLVGLAMTYELGPIMTCIIVAGRSGSSFASEIGTMKVSEEIDALFTMGFDPVRFLVIPKMLASVVVVPILVLFSDLFAILGGMVVGVFILDLSPHAYVTQTVKSLTVFYVFWGVLKSLVFAVIISWVGCLRGFQVKGGADSVGKATTSAVVSSIFMIIVIDAIFAIIHIYWF
ncbi:MAG: MlaE family lipid ABC transporter permease subunit [Deltaproteobacteria bacterium]|nr:MlaE family lipid ABC transporter permease subunit [Deltaproteobacteria bacterium]